MALTARKAGAANGERRPRKYSLSVTRTTRTRKAGAPGAWRRSAEGWALMSTYAVGWGRRGRREEARCPQGGRYRRPRTGPGPPAAIAHKAGAGCGSWPEQVRPVRAKMTPRGRSLADHPRDKRPRFLFAFTQSSVLYGKNWSWQKLGTTVPWSGLRAGGGPRPGTRRRQRNTCACAGGTQGRRRDGGPGTGPS